MIPHSTFTLDAVRVSQGTGTGVSAQTFSPMAYPGFTEVTYRPLEVAKRTYKLSQYIHWFVGNSPPACIFKTYTEKEAKTATIGYVLSIIVDFFFCTHLL